MRIKHLLSFLFFLFLFTGTQAQQQMKPADPALQQRLMKYTADNHLPYGKSFMYFDTVSKRPVRFTTGSFLVEDASATPPADSHTSKAAKGSTPAQLGATGNFHLVRDIDTFTSSYPQVNDYFTDYNAQHFAVLNGVAYFSANDGIHGGGLWRSDGTAAGTYLVKSFSNSYDYTYIFSVGGKIYFHTYTYTGSNTGYKLWVSDGTEAGTLDITPVGNPFQGGPSSFCAVGNEVYFTATLNYSYNAGLWKTDGTQAGTMLVKDFTSFNIAAGSLHNLVSANGLLFFVAFDPITGSELYRSDGTEAGTYLVKDINTSANRGFGSYFYKGPSQLTAYNGRLYFEADDGTLNPSHSRLWVSDGTASGTSVVTGNNDVQLYAYGYQTFGINRAFVISNNVLYFPGYTDGTGWELYKYDAASADGVSLVKDITPGYGGYVIPYPLMADVNGTLNFCYANTAIHLYTTTGTAASVTDVKDFALNTINSIYGGNGQLYFSHYEPATGYEPWTSDGTPAGTRQMTDLYPGDASSGPMYFAAINNSVLFSAFSGTVGQELFKASGSAVTLVKDINTTATDNSSPYYVAPFKNGVICSALTPDIGVEPWLATSSGANVLADVYPGAGSSFPHNFIQAGNVTYFVADSAAIPNVGGYWALYKTDGTAAGTVKISPYTAAGYDVNFTVSANGTVYYVLRNTNTSTYDLWKTDGSSSGNVLLHKFISLINDYNFITNNVDALTAVGNTVYFGADDSNTGNELWKTDGTVAGTVLVKDINPGTASSDPIKLTAFNNRLYFITNAYVNNERGIWTSDGTTGGTIELSSAQADNLTVSGNSLFFTAYTDSTGIELWKTDGTTAGTGLVKDIITGTGNSYPSILTDVNGTLFFAAVDSASTYQLWKSDGSTNSTTVIADLGTYSDTYIRPQSAVADDNLFFMVNDQLWVSDGTGTGTGRVPDPVLDSISVSDVVANGNLLFLTGYNYKYGYELYAGDATLSVLPVTLTAFTASLKGSDVMAQWQTSSEVNTSYFNIQRSTDGVHFNTVGRADAKGSGSTYSYPDVNVANLVSVKTIYYRLQIVDKDGSTSFSKTVPVDINLKEAVVLLLPNPVKDVLRIRVNNYDGKASISVFDAGGKSVYSVQKAIQSGSDVTINASFLQSGVYMVKVSLNGKVIERKFVKE